VPHNGLILDSRRPPSCTTRTAIAAVWQMAPGRRAMATTSSIILFQPRASTARWVIATSVWPDLRKRRHCSRRAPERATPAHHSDCERTRGSRRMDAVTTRRLAEAIEYSQPCSTPISRTKTPLSREWRSRALPNCPSGLARHASRLPTSSRSCGLWPQVYVDFGIANPCCTTPYSR